MIINVNVGYFKSGDLHWCYKEDRIYPNLAIGFEDTLEKAILAAAASKFLRKLKNK
jgi:hypothetical protein